MSVTTHIQQLQNRHEVLETRLHDLKISPSASDVEIKEVKRQKLQLKDEITRLQASN